MKKILLTTLTMMSLSAMAQNVMSPETLWKLGRVSSLGISKDAKNVVYKVTTPSIEENKSNSKFYIIPVNGGTPTEVTETKDLVKDKNISPDGKYLVYNEEVKISNVLGKDFYPELEKSEAQIYDGLDYRHWDTWNEGKFNHVLYKENAEGAVGTDIMGKENFDSPQKPFGGDEDYIWSPDSKKILYVSKKKAGTQYAISTNTSIFEYSLETGLTTNRTEENPGYDVAPQFSPSGNLTWLQMKREGYEADKNDIIVDFKGIKMNLTANWDGTVDSFIWSKDGSKVYFTAAIDGTKQLFEVNFPGMTTLLLPEQI
jgi:Tol biopolymer transport system component